MNNEKECRVRVGLSKALKLEEKDVASIPALSLTLSLEILRDKVNDTHNSQKKTK